MDTNSRYDVHERFEPAPGPHVNDAHGQQRDHSRGSRFDAPKATVEFGSGWYHAAAIEDASGGHAHPYR